MPYPSVYRSPDYSTSYTGRPQPTWAEYLAKYNANAASNTQAYRSSTGAGGQNGSGNGVTNTYNRFDAGGGMGTAALMNMGRYAAGDSSGVDNFGRGTNAVQHGSDFQSDPDKTYAQQTYHDWMADNKSGVALLPGANNWRSVQSYQSHKRAQRAQAEYQARMVAEQEQTRRTGMRQWAESLDPRIGVEMDKRRAQSGDQSGGFSEADVQNMARQLKQTDLEGRLTNDVTQYFNDPNHAIHNNERIDAQKQQTLGGYADQYNQLLTKQAQNAAQRGVLGSSMDISNRGELGRARDAAAVGAENQAQAQKSQFAQQQNQYKEQLMALIHSGNPAAAQYAQQQLGSLDSTTQNQLDLIGSQQQMGAINDYASSLQSQALGGGLNAGAKGISAYGPYLYQYMNRGG